MTLSVLMVVGAAKAVVQFNIGKDGSYSIDVDAVTWLGNASTSFQSNGSRHSTQDGSLTLTNVACATGYDKLGSFQKTDFIYAATQGGLNATASVRVYDVTDDYGFAVFSQLYPVGASKTSVGNMHGVISHFPAFQVEDPKLPLGVLAYGDLMSGWMRLNIQQWSANMSALPGGLFSGPLVLFDQHDNVLIVSAFNHFTANSYYHDTKGRSIAWGIMGNVSEVPAGYTMETIVFYSSNGINAAMEEWGFSMRKMYGRTSFAMDTDVTVTHLGFYTDNGGYYYHLTVPNKTYEDTFFDVYHDSVKRNIPYRYLQYDDYWYYIEHSHWEYGAILKWEPMPSIFPHGLQYLYDNMALPVIAHNRYWSYKTPYAKQNGGDWDFLIDSESGMALPLQQEFWDWLLFKAKTWGLITYEQDFMCTQMENIGKLNSDLHLAETWLHQMGHAAAKYNLKMQFCMTLPRQIMAALEIPVVSHARASGDYVESKQWQIGITSLFLHAMRIAPFKDNFWTTADQPGNPYRRTEVNPVREAVVALFSTGPVAISDKLGLTNTSVINRLVRSDGLLLKPGRPATAINAQIWQSAFGGSLGPDGEVWSSVYYIGTIPVAVIFASNLQTPYSVTYEQVGFYEPFAKNYDLMYYAMDDVTSAPTPFRKYPVKLKSCLKNDLCVFYVAPRFSFSENVDIVFMGELSKYVPLSPQRVTDIRVLNNDLTVLVQGAPAEHVTMSFWVNQSMLNVECVIGSEGTATLSVMQKACY